MPLVPKFCYVMLRWSLGYNIFDKNTYSNEQIPEFFQELVGSDTGAVFIYFCEFHFCFSCTFVSGLQECNLFSFFFWTTKKILLIFENELQRLKGRGKIICFRFTIHRFMIPKRKNRTWMILHHNSMIYFLDYR